MQFVFEFVDFFVEFNDFKLFVGEGVFEFHDFVHDLFAFVERLGLDCVEGVHVGLESFNLIFILPDFLQVVFNVPPAFILFPPQVLSFSLQVGSFSFCFLGGPDDF